METKEISYYTSGEGTVSFDEWLIAPNGNEIVYADNQIAYTRVKGAKFPTKFFSATGVQVAKKKNPNIVKSLFETAGDNTLAEKLYYQNTLLAEIEYIYYPSPRVVYTLVTTSAGLSGFTASRMAEIEIAFNDYLLSNEYLERFIRYQRYEYDHMTSVQEAWLGYCEAEPQYKLLFTQLMLFDYYYAENLGTPVESQYLAQYADYKVCLHPMDLNLVKKDFFSFELK